MGDRRRRLPSVDRLLLEPEIRALLHTAPRIAVVDAVRESLAAARSRRAGPPENWAIDVRERLSERARSSLRPVLNATGVVLHTNLGRAPLAPEAVLAMAEVPPATATWNSISTPVSGVAGAITAASPCVPRPAPRTPSR
jgi:L-seryl-tRNA(Ser) seleniumtransferase